MKQLSNEAAAIHATLAQMVADYWVELDNHGASDITRFYTDDCQFSVVGAYHADGHAGVRRFYDDRDELVRREKDGARTTRHCFSNLNIALTGSDRASVAFVMINYSGAGNPPVRGFLGPSMVCDVTMQFRRDTWGNWLIGAFEGLPIFLGGEAFADKVLSRGQAPIS